MSVSNTKHLIENATTHLERLHAVLESEERAARAFGLDSGKYKRAESARSAVVRSMASLALAKRILTSHAATRGKD
jgi:hypothetical protein